MTPTPSQGPPIPQGRRGGLMGYDHDHGRGVGGGGGDPEPGTYILTGQHSQASPQMVMGLHPA